MSPEWESEEVSTTVLQQLCTWSIRHTESDPRLLSSRAVRRGGRVQARILGMIRGQVPYTRHSFSLCSIPMQTLSHSAPPAMALPTVVRSGVRQAPGAGDAAGTFPMPALRPRRCRTGQSSQLCSGCVTRSRPSPPASAAGTRHSFPR